MEYLRKVKLQMIFMAYQLSGVILCQEVIQLCTLYIYIHIFSAKQA